MAGVATSGSHVATPPCRSAMLFLWLWRSYATLARSCASQLAALHLLLHNEPPTSTISTLANSRTLVKLFSSGLLLESWFLGLPESTPGYVQQIQAMLELVTGDGLGQHVRCIF